MARIFDIVEFVDESATELVHRIPERGSGDFRLGSQVIVRDSQAAVFFRNGRALDVFGPGPHTIATANIPLLVDLIGKAFSGETPFKAEVYFVSLREFTDLKWGTPTPITIPDPILRMANQRSPAVHQQDRGHSRDLPHSGHPGLLPLHDTDQAHRPARRDGQVGHRAIRDG
jgi:hypothetical protein